MGEESYLTIGEVLGLLLEEFPDATISKIRFLESQGLVEPQRTPSGYRKFSERDIDRLRFVMREQKNHYLPLRVIKDRLNGSDLTSPGGPRPIPSGAAWATVAGGANEVRDIVARAARISADITASDQAPPGGVLVPIDFRFRSVDDHHLDDEPQELPDTSRHPSWIGLSSVEDLPIDDDAAGDTALPVEPPADPRPTEPSRIDSEPAALPNVAMASLGLATPDVPPANISKTVEPPHAVELSLVALMAATGATEKLISELESYGLLAARTAGPSPVYDSSAIELVTIAKGFADRGIDARHLRTWRTSAEREAGLFEQLVVPLVRQRNPQSREQAAQLVNELSTLGAALREHLLSGLLSRYIER